MSIGIENFSNITPADADYPYGSIKNDTGPNDGTPVNKLTYDDFHQTFRRLLVLAGITPNNLPDNITNGYQYVDAILRLSKRSNGVIETSVGMWLMASQVRNVIIAESQPWAIGHALPDAFFLQDGDSYIFYNNGSFPVTIVPMGIDTLMGGTSITLTANGDYVELILDKPNINWVIANYKNTPVPAVVIPIPKPLSVQKFGGGSVGTGNSLVIVHAIEGWDPDTAHSIVTGRYIAPKTGYYRISTNGNNHIAAATSTDLGFYNYVNGINKGYATTGNDNLSGYTGGGVEFFWNGNSTVFMNQGDYYELRIDLMTSETLSSGASVLLIEYCNQ